MQNFYRVLRLALQHRFTLAAIIVSSLVVAFFWCANIGALYPVLKVAFTGSSLQEWVETETIKLSESLTSIDTELAQQEELLISNDPVAQGAARDRIAALELQRATDHESLRAYRRLKPIVNHPWVPRSEFQTVVVIVVGLLFATMVKGIFLFANMMFSARLEQRVLFELRRSFYHHALRMDQKSFGTQRTSDLMSHFHADIGCVVGAIRSLFGTAIREPLKMIACLIFAAIISWKLLLFSLLLSPLMALLIRKLAGSIKRANRRALEEISHLYAVLTETFDGILTVQAYNLEQHERKKFHRVSKACYGKGMKIAMYNACAKPMTEVLGLSFIGLAIIAGAYVTLSPNNSIFGIPFASMDTPSLLIFFGLLIGATEPARKLSDVFNSIQAGVAAADRLYPLLDQEPTITNSSSPTNVPQPIRRIVFDRVHFQYTPDCPTLTNINFSVQEGETIAIVGPNGCGKTTLINLLPRFIDPTSGTVSVNDTDLRDLRLKDLRDSLGIVTQQARLFDDSVYNNIRLGNMAASEADVIRAAKQARAHAFISNRLDDGYDTNVGVGGNRLSGGQRQRVALARAILRDPDILILDEATSQIDIESEQLIHQALEQFVKDRTAFIITHRLATLALADQVLVMNEGRIEDFGPHDELMKRCRLYQRLHQIQFQQSA